MSNLDLEKFDGQYVRITDDRGDVFDGICSYNNADYNEHEYGECEDGLELIYMVFFKSQIKDVQSLEEHTGPYGKFLDPYGRMEEMAVEDGADSIEDMLFCDNNEHVMRMMRCLEKYVAQGDGFLHLDNTMGSLNKLIEYTDDDEVRKEAERLVEICKRKE